MHRGYQSTSIYRGIKIVLLNRNSALRKIRATSVNFLRNAKRIESRSVIEVSIRSRSVLLEIIIILDVDIREKYSTAIENNAVNRIL